MLVRAQADADRVVGAAARADLFDHLEEQSDPAFERVAAIRVRPPVRRTREELRDQVSVRAVNLNAVVAAGLEVRGRTPERVHDHPDLARGHLVRRRRIARCRDRRRPHRHRLGQPAG
jgi:hypothetical protein